MSRDDGRNGLSTGLIEPADRGRLLKHRDGQIAGLAKKLLSQSAADSRARVILDYATAIRSGGDQRRGAKVFERECKTCHKIGEQGFALGPDLAGSPSRDPAALLSNILDPNASVSPKDVQYVAVDQNGRTYSGIIAAQTATSLTLERGEGGAGYDSPQSGIRACQHGVIIDARGIREANFEGRDGGSRCLSVRDTPRWRHQRRPCRSRLASARYRNFAGIDRAGRLNRVKWILDNGFQYELTSRRL